jgi:glucokinase
VRAAIGIDVGGTKIAAAVVDEAGAVLGEAQRETTAKDTHTLVTDMRACARDAWARAAERGGPASLDDIAAVGAGIPAQVELDGTIPHCTNLPYLVGSDVVGRLADVFGMPVAVENDANLAALGEAIAGDEPTDSLVMLALGTGVGGGVVIDGKMLRGPHGSAGEIGHMVVLAGGPECPCGQRGCIEALVAAPYVAGRAREGLCSSPDGGESSLWQVDGAPDEVSPEDVEAAARAGDAFAARIMAETGGYLGAALSSLANIFAPRRMVIGGGFGMAAADLLLPAARQAVERDALAGSRRGLRIDTASLGQHAGVVGAALFALAARDEGSQTNEAGRPTEGT